MVAVTILKNIEYGTRSRQMRRVLAKVSMSVAETIVASDVQLSSIEALQAQAQNDGGIGTISATAGTLIQARVNAPGSFANAGNLAYVGGIGYRVTAGTLDGAIALAGSHTWAVQADGW